MTEQDDEPEFLGYHDDDPERRKKTAPLYLRLKISPTTLPERISRLYVRRLYSRRALEERREKAFDAFGRPGRGLRPVSGAFDALSEALGWGPQLRARRLADDWPDIVGPFIATNTRVASYRNGEIVVIVSDPAWTHALMGMRETVLQKVNDWMAPTVVSRLVFRTQRTGAEARTRGGLRVPRRGVRADRSRTATGNGEIGTIVAETARKKSRKDAEANHQAVTKDRQSQKPAMQSGMRPKPQQGPQSDKPHNGWSDPGAGSASPSSWGGGWG